MPLEKRTTLQLGEAGAASTIARRESQHPHDYTAGAEVSLERAKAHGWTVISIKADWATVFAA
jgi:hypothetical protein